jgi:signal recognition particle receptor subunit beta
LKIVYYGPALSGKTTNLQIIHKKVPPEAKGDMVSLATESDRTLFFDFLPIDLGKIKGFTTKIQLYTVPGQVYYNATRKLVLRGVDGIVFVADSGAEKMAENIESLNNMEENLAECEYPLESIPIVLQFNKRDLENPIPVEELESKLNRYGSKSICAAARTGEGVFDTLKAVSKEVIDALNRKYEKVQAPQTPQKTVEKPKVAVDYDIEFNSVAEEASPSIEIPTQTIESVSFDDLPASAPKIQDPEPQDFADVESFSENAALDSYFDDEPIDILPIQTQEKISVKQEEIYEEILENPTNDSYQQYNSEKERKAESMPQEYTEIQLEDAFDSPVGNEAEPSPQSALNSQAAESDAKSEPESAVKHSIPVLEDVLDDVPSVKPKAPTTAGGGEDVVSQAIKSAFDDEAGDKMPPDNMVFTTVDVNSRKMQQFIAAKKKPINPKYKKNFLENLFPQKSE